MVTVTIRPDQAMRGGVDLIMPRSVPGAYSAIKYDMFLRGVEVEDVSGQWHAMTKNEDDGPRWHLDAVAGGVRSVHYQVDLEAMEAMLSTPADASIRRKGFVGMLNYSVLGWLEGMDDLPVVCDLRTPSDWPIFSTLAPSATPQKGSMQVKAPSYHVLADAQTFLGYGFRVMGYGSEVPLFIVSYAEETVEYLDDYAWQERFAMGALKKYFGELPFPCYTLVLRKSIPKRPLTSPPLAMEHLQSSTFFGDTSAVRKGPMTEEMRMRTITTYLHHMGHAFIPLRSYGDAYRPRMMEAPPIIDDIWYNEGFIWWLCYDTLKNPAILKRFENGVYQAPGFIRKLDLFSLSRLASTQYADDFRIGMGVFSRGGLMAEEMDQYLRKRSGGRKGMRDVLRYLYQWSRREKRPFTLEEFPGLLKQASGEDLSAIYERWKKPVE